MNPADESLGMVRSFSGRHPYRPQCVIDEIVTEWAQDDIDMTVQATEKGAAVTVKIDGGICPRCDGELDLQRNSGSRATRCRCVPVCPACGADEANQGILRVGLAQIWRWPLRKGDITRRRNKVAQRSTPTEGMLVGGKDNAEPVMLTEDGVSQVKMHPHPGGWAEFGFDDTEDEAERDA